MRNFLKIFDTIISVVCVGLSSIPLVFAILFTNYYCFTTDGIEKASSDGVYPVGVWFISTILILLSTIVTISFLKLIYNKHKKCKKCESRFSTIGCGGTVYTQYVCVDCGEIRWEQHSYDKDKHE